MIRRDGGANGQGADDEQENGHEARVWSPQGDVRGRGGRVPQEVQEVEPAFLRAMAGSDSNGSASARCPATAAGSGQGMSGPRWVC